MDQEYLKSIIDYDPLSGIFTWRLRDESMFNHCKNPKNICAMWNTRFGGSVAGHSRKEECTSYIQVTIKLGIKARQYRAHHLAWLYMTGSFPSLEIDHKDHNGENNSWDNLRCVNHGTNQKNKKRHKNNSSGEHNIYWNTKYSKWCVCIVHNKKKICEKTFHKMEEAIIFRDKKLLEFKFSSTHGLEVK